VYSTLFVTFAFGASMSFLCAPDLPPLKARTSERVLVSANWARIDQGMSTCVTSMTTQILPLTGFLWPAASSSK